RRNEFGEHDFADEPIALVQRLADLDDESVRRVERSDANRRAAMGAVEKYVLSRRDRRWRIHFGGAIDDVAMLGADLKDHRVELVVDERLERFLRQVDARP